MKALGALVHFAATVIGRVKLPHWLWCDRCPAVQQWVWQWQLEAADDHGAMPCRCGGSLRRAVWA